MEAHAYPAVMQIIKLFMSYQKRILSIDETAKLLHLPIANESCKMANGRELARPGVYINNPL